MIRKRIHETYESVDHAVSALAGQLSIDRQVQEKQLARQEIEERAAFIEEIASDYSRDPNTQDIQRNKLQFQSTEALRGMLQNIQERRSLALLTPEQLRAAIRQRREWTAPAPSELPTEITRQQIKQMSPEQIRALIQRYGKPQVDKRLGYVKPEISGTVRNVNIQI